MKKKFLSLFLLLCLVSVFTLTGCNNKQEKVNYTDIEQLGEFDTTKDVTITFYHSMGQDLQQKLDGYIADFNELYPNINVEHKSLGNYSDIRDQLSKDLGVGAEANVSYCYPDHVASYLASGKVLNMDLFINDTKYGYGFVDDDTFASDFIEGYYNEGKQFGDGHMYCLPFSKSTEVLYYNKTFFEANGYSVPTTWDEMEALCRDIKSKHPNDIPLGYDSSSNLFITFAEQLNSGYTSATKDNDKNSNFLFNNQTNIDFVKKVRGWYKDGLIETADTYGGINKQYTSALFTQLDVDHNTGEALPRSYMCIGSSAGASYQKPASNAFEVGIAEIPSFTTSNKKVVSQGPSVCIFQDSDPQKVIASWLFVRFFTTNIAFQADFSSVSGYVPVIKSVFENTSYINNFLNKADGYDHIQALSCTVCKNQSEHYFTSPAFDGSANARDVVGKLLYDSMLAESEDRIKTLFDAAIQECEFYTI